MSLREITGFVLLARSSSASCPMIRWLDLPITRFPLKPNTIPV
jgi:hypothetical protein